MKRNGALAAVVVISVLVLGSIVWAASTSDGTARSVASLEMPGMGMEGSQMGPAHSPSDGPPGGGWMADHPMWMHNHWGDIGDRMINHPNWMHNHWGDMGPWRKPADRV